MDLYTSFAIITLAALMHAGFQLSVSMVTLLGSHTIGNKLHGSRITRLVLGFYGGVVAMTMLVVSFLAYLANVLYHTHVPATIWAVVCGLMIGIGVAVWTFYYRRRAGTSLWIPRAMARFLEERTKSTKSPVESFSLGITSVVSELIFVVAPALVAALALTYLPGTMQLAGLVLYVLVATFGVGVVTLLICSGHKISTVQKWREQNKRFLQFIAGSGFLVLGAYVYANLVATASLVTGSLLQ